MNMSEINKSSSVLKKHNICGICLRVVLCESKLGDIAVLELQNFKEECSKQIVHLDNMLITLIPNALHSMHLSRKSRICNNCTEYLKTAYEFHIKCKYTENLIHQYLSLENVDLQLEELLNYIQKYGDKFISIHPLNVDQSLQETQINYAVEKPFNFIIENVRSVAEDIENVNIPNKNSNTETDVYRTQHFEEQSTNVETDVYRTQHFEEQSTNVETDVYRTQHIEEKSTNVDVAPKKRKRRTRAEMNNSGEKILRRSPRTSCKSKKVCTPLEATDSKPTTKPNTRKEVLQDKKKNHQRSLLKTKNTFKKMSSIDRKNLETYIHCLKQNVAKLNSQEIADKSTDNSSVQQKINSDDEETLSAFSECSDIVIDINDIKGFPCTDDKTPSEPECAIETENTNNKTKFKKKRISKKIKRPKTFTRTYFKSKIHTRSYKNHYRNPVFRYINFWSHDTFLWDHDYVSFTQIGVH